MARGLMTVILALLLSAAGAATWAADFGGGYAEQRGGMCIHMPRSPILDTGDFGLMRTEVEQRYAHALDVSMAGNTIANRSPRFTWAIEAKIACGKAIGYFKGREVNGDMISRCDCYYNRMMHYLR